MDRLIKIPLQHRCLLGIRNAQRIVQKRNLGEVRSVSGSGSAKGEDPNRPILFFGSGAEKIRATPVAPVRTATYSPYIVNLSLAVFMFYFMYLREENDIDELFKRDLYDHFGEEASRLKKAYDYNIKHNLPTNEIVNRLREIGAPVPPQM
ncbi:uncharacterized protein LOC129573748 [Sitodiplosis mosellana]|uniref:uncharacterized protein LOC129573748 n=1 Tax=Sitodiplosis mosellana TaxID=263140 RepID=UPI0024446B3C|nr:uncharacterized protein LOC129573748 [Sitodiplosis mosellana]